jgi:hypothetical protein
MWLESAVFPVIVRSPSTLARFGPCRRGRTIATSIERQYGGSEALIQKKYIPPSSNQCWIRLKARVSAPDPQGHTSCSPGLALASAAVARGAGMLLDVIRSRFLHGAERERSRLEEFFRSLLVIWFRSKPRYQLCACCLELERSAPEP